MKSILISQYQASLKMILKTIEKCPDDLWENNTYENAYWRIVYHSLFYTALYLSESDDTFIPWTRHIFNCNVLGAVDHGNNPIVIKAAYSKTDMISYADSILNNLDELVVNLDTSGNSGFEWLPMSKMQLHIYNIRHLQHHVGQLVERLHQNGVTGIHWVR
ncbi:MAG: hypothetical protein M3O71_20785 [Bacteroidota bacterium]|nr:hypothetical protein [Bacteroidota bacterium]